jgi:hypothetical protein
VELNIPENSIPAWQWAIDNCANIVDLDAQNAAAVAEPGARLPEG